MSSATSVDELSAYVFQESNRDLQNVFSERLAIIFCSYKKKTAATHAKLHKLPLPQSADDFQTDFIQRDCSACAGVARHENQLAGPLIQIRIC